MNMKGKLVNVIGIGITVFVGKEASSAFQTAFIQSVCSNLVTMVNKDDENNLLH